MNARVLIGQSGLSFTRAAGGEAFDEKCREISSLMPTMGGLTLRFADLGDPRRDRRPLLTLLRRNEAASRIELMHLRAVPAVLKVLEDAPELLDPYTGDKGIHFDHVGVGHNDAGVHFVKLYARDDSRPAAERGAILSSLDALAPDADIEWPVYTPEVTLISADPHVPIEGVDLAAAAVRSVMPIDAELARVAPRPSVPMRFLRPRH